MPVARGIFRVPAASRSFAIPSRPRSFTIPTSIRKPMLRATTPKSQAEAAKATKPVEKVAKRVYPSDGLVRAQAHASAHDRTLWVSERIERFERVSVMYCQLALGYKDKHVREEWIYLELKRKVQACRDAKTSLPKEELPAYARVVVSEMEQIILQLAERGRRIVRECTETRMVVMCTIGRKTSKKCFLILEGANNQRVVKCLETAAQHARHFKTRMRPGKIDFRKYSTRVYH